MTTKLNFEIHVVADRQALRRRVADLAPDASPLVLDLTPVSDLDELERALFVMLQVPIPARTFDAVISLAPDIDLWMPDATSWVVEVSGLDECPTDVARVAVDVLPPILDRWRSMAEKSFVAVLAASTSRGFVLEALRAENERLKKSGERPGRVTYIGPVPVYVDGVLDEVASAGASPSSSASPTV